MPCHVVLPRNAPLNVRIAVVANLRIVLYVLQIHLHAVADSIFSPAVRRINPTNDFR